MYSFYGGQAGKPFVISTIFSNKIEMVNDLKMRWSSNIMPGEIVLISYGSYDLVDSDNSDKTQYQTNYDIDYPVYGKNYNGTLWEKIYYEPTEQDIEDLFDSDFVVNDDPGGTGFEDITDGRGYAILMNNQEVIFYSRDYGLGYKLITSMTGMTPELGVADPTIILGPLEDPNVEIDISNVNNPELQFYLPRAVRFFFGDLLGQDSMPQVDAVYSVDSSLMSSEIRKGDYYINRNTGYVFLLNDIQGSSLSFVFKACFQPPAPETVHNIGTAYYLDSDGTTYRPNYPRFSFVKIANGWQAVITTPREPNLVVGTTNFVGPLEQGYTTGQILNTNDYQFNFHIPRGSEHFTGSEVEGSPISTVVVANSKPGDIYVNTNINSQYNGHVYQLNLNSQWEDRGSIKGSTGDALKIVGSYTITPTEVATDSLIDVGNYLTGLGISLDDDELIAVTYVNENNEDTAYWYYQLNDSWNRLRITGGINSILRDQYVVDSDEGYIYTTRYINSLIVSQNSPSVNPDRNTYNITTINELLNDVQIFWKNF